jgi:hypothetical protein
MHAAVDGLMLEYRRAALFYGAGCGRLALCPGRVAGGWRPKRGLWLRGAVVAG